MLNATIRFHLEKYLEENKDLIRRLLCFTYVDDIISGGRNEDEAFHLYTESKKIFHEGEFNLRKFLTNFRESKIADSSPLQYDLTYSEVTLGVSQTREFEEHKTLGVPWNTESNKLIFDISDLAPCKTCS